jgi:hypothetical protein
MEKQYLKLEPSERSLLIASASILSAHVAANQHALGSEEELVEKSVRLALLLAEQIETTVIADEELPEA